MKKLLVVAGLSLLAGTAFAGQYVEPLGPHVPGEFIVVFNPKVDVGNAAQALAREHGAEVARQWKVIPGVHMRGLSTEGARALARNPNVKYVEHNGFAHITATQTGATWGLDRVDQRALPLDGNYNYNFDGTDVHAYILDTGCRMTHNDFGGRFGNGYDFIDNDPDPSDCHGHGTHVAGTVGGATWGVAKNVTLHAVRVLNCSGSGTWAQVISGVDWVTANFVAPAVANMSLAGSTYQALDDAVNASVQAGVFYAVAAANNYAADACNYSPAGAAEAFTVAASTATDARSSFSNIGPCVDIYAPGSSITSAWYTSDTATNTISGTSMASPHVCGAGALVRDEFPGYTVDQVKAELLARATADVITDAGANTTDDLLHTLGEVLPPCTGDPDCDDGQFCNGAETCVGGTCQPGTDPCVPPQTCDEVNDLCVVCGQRDDPCTVDSDCCSEKCRGRTGSKTCR